MWKNTLIIVGVFSCGIAFHIWFATQHWYQTVPGVQGTGPLNYHFAKDVALAFLTSGGALIWAGIKVDKSAAVCGSAWLVFHALFHIWIWMHRGTPVDLIALTNLTGIQLPAVAALYAAINLKKEEAQP